MFIATFKPSSIYDKRNVVDSSKCGALYGWVCDEKREYKMYKQPSSKNMRLNFISYYYNDGVISRYTSFDDKNGDGYSFKDDIKYNVKEEDINEVIANDFRNLFGNYSLSKWSSEANKIFTLED